MGKLAYVSIDIPAVYKQACAEVTQLVKDQLWRDDITFEPVADEVLHMTIAFMGNTLRNQKPEVHDRLSLIVQNYSSQLRGSSLAFASYALFPPSKKNLLVATFAMSGKTLAVIKNLKRDVFGLGLLSEERETFVAHITLGKILSKTSQHHAIDWTSFMAGLPHLGDFSADGCSLRGWP